MPVNYLPPMSRQPCELPAKADGRAQDPGARREQADHNGPPAPGRGPAVARSRTATGPKPSKHAGLRPLPPSAAVRQAGRRAALQTSVYVGRVRRIDDPSVGQTWEARRKP
jgi:hypothetical protein